MRASILNAYFMNEVAFDDFIKDIDQDVERYFILLQTPGSKISLSFHEDEQLLVNKANIKKLIDDIISFQTSPVALSYICDCLTLGEYVEYTNESIHEMLCLIADPEINGGYKSYAELSQLSETLL